MGVAEENDEGALDETEIPPLTISPKQGDILSDHNLPTLVMGDIELYLRTKQQKIGSSKGLLYSRDPSNSDEENAALNRPYCGNPFVAPGTLGFKGQSNALQLS